MTRLTWLADVLRAAGLTVVEHPGWQTHAVSGTWSPQFGVVHATAAPARQSDSVQVSVVRDGRQGLPGPIANCVVDRQGRWHVVAAGRCNTTLPGTAGPYRGMGNSYALGVEGCNDNLSEPWPDAQYRSYVWGWAAICRRLGWTAKNLVGHREHTPGHKSDPTFDMDRFRAAVAAVLAEGDDMALTDADIDKIATRTAAKVWGTTFTSSSTEARWPGKGEKPALIWLVLSAIHAHDAAKRSGASTDVDEQAIIAGILAGLSPQAIAAAIPSDLAAQVVDELAQRIAANALHRPTT